MRMGSGPAAEALQTFGTFEGEISVISDRGAVVWRHITEINETSNAQFGVHELEALFGGRVHVRVASEERQLLDRRRWEGVFKPVWWWCLNHMRGELYLLT